MVERRKKKAATSCAARFFSRFDFFKKRVECHRPLAPPPASSSPLLSHRAQRQDRETASRGRKGSNCALARVGKRGCCGRKNRNSHPPRRRRRRRAPSPFFIVFFSFFFSSRSLSLVEFLSFPTTHASLSLSLSRGLASEEKDETRPSCFYLPARTCSTS